MKNETEIRALYALAEALESQIKTKKPQPQTGEPADGYQQPKNDENNEEKTPDKKDSQKDKQKQQQEKSDKEEEKSNDENESDENNGEDEDDDESDGESDSGEDDKGEGDEGEGEDDSDSSEDSSSAFTYSISSKSESSLKEEQTLPEISAIINMDDEDKNNEQTLPQSISPLDDPNYRINTTKHDKILKVTDEIKKKNLKLETLREKIDRLMPNTQSLVSQLSAKLQRHIQAQQTRSWRFDCDDGLLDPARLSRIITSPLDPLAYRQEHEGKFLDTTITLLVDNSGSMAAYKKIQIAALTSDILTRVLERCGVTVEVLGFTATAQRGPSMSRNSSLIHYIYKDATIPYRRVRANFGFMLSTKLIQNVDGEALIWAHNRLISRPQPRKILIVLSDGKPADACSDGQMLSNHLKFVTSKIESANHIDLFAIGMGFNVEQYYKNSIIINDINQVAPMLLTQMIEMFKTSNRRSAK